MESPLREKWGRREGMKDFDRSGWDAGLIPRDDLVDRRMPILESNSMAMQLGGVVCLQRHFRTLIRGRDQAFSIDRRGSVGGPDPEADGVPIPCRPARKSGRDPPRAGNVARCLRSGFVGSRQGCVRAVGSIEVSERRHLAAIPGEGTKLGASRHDFRRWRSNWTVRGILCNPLAHRSMGSGYDWMLPDLAWSPGCRDWQSCPGAWCSRFAVGFAVRDSREGSLHVPREATSVFDRFRGSRMARGWGMMPVEPIRPKAHRELVPAWNRSLAADLVPARPSIPAEWSGVRADRSFEVRWGGLDREQWRAIPVCVVGDREFDWIRSFPLKSGNPIQQIHRRAASRYRAGANFALKPDVMNPLWQGCRSIRCETHGSWMVARMFRRMYDPSERFDVRSPGLRAAMPLWTNFRNARSFPEGVVAVGRLGVRA